MHEQMKFCTVHHTRILDIFTNCYHVLLKL